MKRNVCSHCNILISGKIIKEMSGSVASGTHCNSRQLVWATVTVEMVSRYCVPSYILNKLCIASIVSGIIRY